MQKMQDRKNIGKIILDPTLEPKPKPVSGIFKICNYRQVKTCFVHVIEKLIFTETVNLSGIYINRKI